MDTLIKSIIGFNATQSIIQQHPTEKELTKELEIVHSKAIISSCYNVFYSIVALISAGLIKWIFQ